jgi:hypothetical protein
MQVNCKPPSPGMTLDFKKANWSKYRQALDNQLSQWKDLMQPQTPEKIEKLTNLTKCSVMRVSLLHSLLLIEYFDRMLIDSIKNGNTAIQTHIYSLLRHDLVLTLQTSKHPQCDKYWQKQHELNSFSHTRRVMFHRSSMVCSANS